MPIAELPAGFDWAGELHDSAGMLAPVVLLVEDDENDDYFFRRNLRKVCPSCTVHHVKGGQAAMNYLSGVEPYADREQYPFPLVMVLDLHLLVMSGFEVLAWVRQHPQFKDLPVVVLSGSARPGDAQRARQLGATEFFEKSPDYRRVIDYVQTLVRRNPVAQK